MNINNFLEILAANASRNFKIEKLTEQKNNETLKEVIRLAYDPFTQFYIRKIPAYKPNQHSIGGLQTAMDMLFDLSSRAHKL